jgi:hypothetical protein
MYGKQRYHKGTCAKTGKRIYLDRLDVLLDHANNPRQIRAYRCEHGRHWHATSKPIRGGRDERGE